VSELRTKNFGHRNRKALPTKPYCQNPPVILQSKMPAPFSRGPYADCTAEKAPLEDKGSCRSQERLRGFECADHRSSCLQHGACPSSPPHCRSALPLRPKGRLCDTALPESPSHFATCTAVKPRDGSAIPGLLSYATGYTTPSVRMISSMRLYWAGVKPRLRANQTCLPL